MRRTSTDASWMIDPANEREIKAIVFPPGVQQSIQHGAPLLVCGVQPWRVVGQAVEATPLALEQPVAEAELRRLQGIVRPWSTIHVRVRLRPAQPTHATLLEWLDTSAEDAELEARGDVLRAQITRDDPLFGTLTFDRSLDWWEADVTWNEQSAKLYLTVDEDEPEPDAPLAVAHALWNEQAVWHQRIVAYAVAQLLDLKNDGWLEDDDDPPVTAQQFADALALESLSVRSDGGFEFTFDDGDLFFGHVIVVSGNLEGGPDDATIAG